MENLPYAQIEKGTFLIATPDIEGGIFFRSVILVCEHNPSGSFGIVVNKSLTLELPEEIINVDTLANPMVQIRAGGPVQTNQMMLLHTSDKIPFANIKDMRRSLPWWRLTILARIDQRSKRPQITYVFWLRWMGSWDAGKKNF